MLTDAQQDALVAEASRAPSVHNIQPARWRFGGDRVTLLRDPARVLPVGDPTGHDVAVSLGAAWEGMAIALSRLGYALGEPERHEGEGGDDPPRDADAARGTVMPRAAAPLANLPGGGAPPRPVASARVTAADRPDPLAGFVQARRSHRGRFTPATDAERDALLALAAPDAVVVADPAGIREIAGLHDRATWHFESRPAYHAELWSWLRLSPAHPDWSRDGLNADCLALSPAERAAARVALRPRVFALLARLGIARHLVSEAAQVRSAAAVVLFAPRRELAPFDVGRRFHRLWLEVAGCGLHAVPMSATSDWDESREALGARFGIVAERRLANVLRVGAAPRVAESPRLPVGEVRLRA